VSRTPDAAFDFNANHFPCWGVFTGVVDQFRDYNRQTLFKHPLKRLPPQFKVMLFKVIPVLMPDRRDRVSSIHRRFASQG